MSEVVEVVEFVDEVAGIYFRSVYLTEGQKMGQHVHPFDHATLVGSGKARLWVDGQWAGDFEAGQAVKVEAHKRHEFMAVDGPVRLTCVHNTESAHYIKELGL